MADIEISYNNSVIASLSDSGTEVLETNGKFLLDDITITYTKSGGENVASNIVYVDYTRTETSSSYTFTLEKTAQELIDLLNNGNIVFIKDEDDKYRQLVNVYGDSNNGYNRKLSCLLSFDNHAGAYTYAPIYTPAYVAYTADSYPFITHFKGGSND